MYAAAVLLRCVLAALASAKPKLCSTVKACRITPQETWSNAVPLGAWHAQLLMGVDTPCQAVRTPLTSIRSQEDEHQTQISVFAMFRFRNVGDSKV